MSDFVPTTVLLLTALAATACAPDESLAPGASQSSDLEPSSYFAIRLPEYPNKCLGDWFGLLEALDCDGSTSQRFLFNGLNEVTALDGASPARCLEVANASTANGTLAAMRPCTHSGAQQWTFAGDGTLRSLLDLRKCLTHTTRPNRPETGWGFDLEWSASCDGSYEQGGGGFCLPYVSAAYYELVISDCNSSPAQQFTRPVAPPPAPAPAPVEPAACKAARNACRLGSMDLAAQLRAVCRALGGPLINLTTCQ